ncbi:MAG: protein kinase [Pirellulaceae bacterium]
MKSRRKSHPPANAASLKSMQQYGGNAHMTWASATLSRSLQGTGAFVRRQVWLWPIIAVILLSIIGMAVHSSIESTMRESLASELTTLRDVEVAMLRTWLASQESNAESMANVKEVREISGYLLRQATPQRTSATTEEPATYTSVVEAKDVLAQRLAPFMTSHDYTGYVVSDREQRVLASSESELEGMQEIPEFAEWIHIAIDGRVTVSKPFPSVAALPDESDRTRTGVPTMFVVAPVRDENLQVVAALGLRIKPEREFTRILQLGRIGDSGETYAFDADGRMLSKSRFEHALILLGLLPDQPNASSLLNVQIRDPLGDMTEGYRPTVRRHELPLTLMAETANSGVDGVNVDGYRDYRGVPVVGAWSWLDEYNFGVATEVDVAEAFRPLTILKRAFWGLMALLMLCSVAIFVFSIMVSRLQRQARLAAIEAKQLGQYKLEDKLGEGAMGVVYRGRHAMLRRPTAIKLIDADKVSETSIERFEREVQITSQLNHPNTIAIYDYGRTPEGVFYYAMEYLDGIDLQHLVDRYGPQCSARVNYILQQICGSLYEAAYAWTRPPRH